VLTDGVTPVSFLSLLPATYTMIFNRMGKNCQERTTRKKFLQERWSHSL